MLQRPVEPSQYTSIALTSHLDIRRITASIGSVGDAYDNAMMETGNGLYKTECIRTTLFHEGPYRDIRDVEYATSGWVRWYNHDRVHSGIGYRTPVQAEAEYYAALNNEKRPA